ncbi:hypothetical protein N8478_01380 [bacterium]|nr:hypothetical protein [bacterium]
MKSTEAINLALHEHMQSNEQSVAMGLGINDPKRIFGTTSDLLESFGPSRIIEPPTSENALTGICLGLAENGFSVCLTHQRFDFALLSLDQIINSIAKWKFMFSKDDQNISLLIRLIVGRGWGQGPTHSQSYHSFLASIPGLNVIYPYNPESFYSAILSGMSAADPTVVIEHRWLHNVQSDKDITQFDPSYSFSSKPKLLSKGENLTIFTYGYVVPDLLQIVSYLAKYNVTFDLLVITNLSKISLTELTESINKTKNLIMIEPFHLESSIISTTVSKLLKHRAIRQNLSNFEIHSLPFEHESTSYFQTSDRYFTCSKLISLINDLLDTSIPLLPQQGTHDVPGDWFKGPF